MPYRVKAEVPPPQPLAKAGLQCARCNVPVSPDDGRCPQCLRRSTVAGPGATIATSDAIEVEPIAVWPATATCPLCSERDVDTAHVFLRVSKAASDVGSRSATLVARVRTCTPCHARVVSLDRWRAGAALSVIVGMLAMAGFFTQTALGVATGLLGVALFVGALASLSTRNRRLRATLDDSGITGALADRIPDVPGLFHFDNQHLSAKTQDPARAVDLSELVAPRRRRR